MVSKGQKTFCDEENKSFICLRPLAPDANVFKLLNDSMM
jgi:hypothetical protein